MLLSIITINYNDRAGLLKTMQSVAAQTCQDFEYIVIDGGSTDGSADLLAPSAAPRRLDYAVSERDKGIYNAMNKGIAAARGEYLLFLNSGDYLYKKDVIEKVLKRIGEGDGKDYYCGHVWLTGRNELQRCPKVVTPYYLTMTSVPHQASFIRRELLIKRPYLETYRIVSDWEQMLYAILYENASFEQMEIVVSVFNLDGMSCQAANKQLRRDEMDDAIRRLVCPVADKIVGGMSKFERSILAATVLPSRKQRDWKMLRKIVRDLLKAYFGIPEKQ